MTQNAGQQNGQPVFQTAGAPQQQPQQGVPQQGMPPPGGGGKAKRRVRNFLLQPLIQVKIGLYSIVLSIFFAVALGVILYFNFSSLFDAIITMTDAKEDVEDIIGSYWRGARPWLFLSFFVYLVAQIGLSVLYTHRLVGPTFAFRRHIRAIAEGRYNVRTYLRRGDAFVEVADELNHLSEVMVRKTQGGASGGPQTGGPA
jgi:hypothetical protein